MTNKILGGILMAAGGTIIATLSGLAFIDYIRTHIACKKVIAKTEGFLKGYLAGNKEFAEYVKENDPELYEKIEAM